MLTLLKKLLEKDKLDPNELRATYNLLLDAMFNADIYINRRNLIAKIRIIANSMEDPLPSLRLSEEKAREELNKVYENAKEAEKDKPGFEEIVAYYLKRHLSKS